MDSSIIASVTIIRLRGSTSLGRTEDALLRNEALGEFNEGERMLAFELAGDSPDVWPSDLTVLPSLPGRVSA
jgi:hypothetical protein